MPTVIGKGCSIGVNANIVCGTSARRDAIIDAGSLVADDLQEFSLICGDSARIRGRVHEKGDIVYRAND